jgi:DNA-binding GntR family transcriptional regulator
MAARPHQESWRQHEQLVDALALRDGDLAAQLMREHILGVSADSAVSPL